MFSVDKQIKRLYRSGVLKNLSMTGAWVALLAARGFSLVQIGLAETVFHITSLFFEIPSGVLADVLGRKRMLMVSALMCMVGNIIMICSNGFGMVCLSLAFHALNYNFASGSDSALAYDSLKTAGREGEFERYESNMLSIYRLCEGLSTLVAGLALSMGHVLAYGIDLVIGVFQLMSLSTLYEIRPGGYMEGKNGLAELGRALVQCFRDSLAFLKEAKRAVGLMLCNSFVGAVDTLLLFFLQALLPERGIPAWGLGLALLFMQMGGIVGARLIVKLPGLSYRRVYVGCGLLVLLGLAASGSGRYLLMVLGGFLSAVGDDALQVRSNARLQELFPSEQRATLTSVDSLLFSIIMIVLSPLAGVLFSAG